MRPEDRTILENQLRAQLTDVERDLGKLEAQRDTLRQLLFKVRRENLTLRDVTRKNSFDRILIESRILETLKANSKALPTKKLYWAAQEINPQLRNSTFRSYLHRLKSRGFITNASSRGHWIAKKDARRSDPAQSADEKSRSSSKSIVDDQIF